MRVAAKKLSVAIKEVRGPKVKFGHRRLIEEVSLPVKR